MAPGRSASGAGLCHVTEGRGVFPGLTVRDNLRMFARRAVKPTPSTARSTPSPGSASASARSPAR